jgi:transcriptional regulator with XRE-family HTH domain
MTGSPIVALFNAALLAAWREESGLSRERVCADLTDQGDRIGYIWLAKLEKGVGGPPSLGLLTALANYYGHDVRDLFTPAEAAS